MMRCVLRIPCARARSTHFASANRHVTTILPSSRSLAVNGASSEFTANSRSRISLAGCGATPGRAGVVAAQADALKKYRVAMINNTPMIETSTAGR